jgi:SP family facilitated glucose transporter-like MFS transporter 1
VAIFCVGGMIGGSIVGFVADRLGRKKGLLYNNVLVLIATILMGEFFYLYIYLNICVVGKDIFPKKTNLVKGDSSLCIDDLL